MALIDNILDRFFPVGAAELSNIPEGEQLETLPEKKVLPVEEKPSEPQPVVVPPPPPAPEVEYLVDMVSKETKPPKPPPPPPPPEPETIEDLINPQGGVGAKYGPAAPKREITMRAADISTSENLKRQLKVAIFGEKPEEYGMETTPELQSEKIFNEWIFPLVSSLAFPAQWSATGATAALKNLSPASPLGKALLTGAKGVLKPGELTETALGLPFKGAGKFIEQMGKAATRLGDKWRELTPEQRLMTVLRDFAEGESGAIGKGKVPKVPEQVPNPEIEAKIASLKTQEHEWSQIAGDAAEAKVKSLTNQIKELETSLKAPKVPVTPEVTPASDVKEWFHGSKQEIDKFALSYEAPGRNVENLFGEGLYVTDNPSIAGTYAKTQGTVYKLTLKPDLKLLDLEKPLPKDAHEAFVNFVKYNDQFLGSIDEQAVTNWIKEGKSGAEIYNRIVDDIIDMPKSEAMEAFGGIVQSLQDKGYEGFSHMGGKYAGKGVTLHNVRILWNPEDAIASRAIAPKPLKVHVKPVTAEVGLQPSAKPPPVAPEAPIKPPIEPPPPSAPPPAVPGGEEFAGNIRLSKYPEGAREIIKDFAERNPELVQPARRGVIPDAEVQAEAKKLVEEMGGDFNKLVKKWKPGQAWNAEEVGAIRGALRSKSEEIFNIKEIINKGDNSAENLVKLQKAITEHAQLQQVTYGVTAEAGRSLRQFRQNAIQALENPNAAKLEEILKMIGGRGKVEEIAQALGKLDVNDVGAVNSFIRSVIKPKLNDYLVELFYNSILSSPKTHIINSASNTLNAVLSPIEKLGSALVEAPTALLQGRPRERLFGEVAQETFGLLRGIPEGVRTALKVIKSGGMLESSKYELNRMKAFTGVPGRIINIPSTLLEAADGMFYGINKTVALRAQAYREAASQGLKGEALAAKIRDLMQNPSESILKKAHDIAEYRLFRQEPGKFTSKVMQMRDAEILNIKPLRFVIPFLRTPVNLVKYGLERSPLAILNPKMWGNFIQKNPEFSDQLARWVIGSSVAAALSIYVADDKITGAPPKSQNERDRFYREGKLPYAIKIGDNWVSYQRLEPFNQVLTQIASAVEGIKGAKEGEDVSDISMNVVSNIGRNFVSQTYMQGISDIIDAIEDPERYGTKWLQRFAASMLTPASGAMRATEQIVSPEVEEPQNIIEAVEANLPLLSSRVSPKLTATGEVAQRQGSAWFPIQISPEQKSPFNEELNRLKFNLGFVGDSIWGVELTDEQKREYQISAGQKSKTAIENVIQSSQYKSSTNDEWKTEQLQKASNQAKDSARDEMLETLYKEGKIVGDKKLVYEYQKAVSSQPDNKQSKFGQILREENPEMDVALNLEGAASTVRSTRALILLIETARERGIPAESLPAIKAYGEKKNQPLR